MTLLDEIADGLRILRTAMSAPDQNARDSMLRDWYAWAAEPEA